MSAIVEFPLYRARLPGAASPGANRAEVVIFPGVRVERRDFSLADRLDGWGLNARRTNLQPALED